MRFSITQTAGFDASSQCRPSFKSRGTKRSVFGL